MSTRTLEDCQDLVELWLEGEEEEVIELLGGEPSDKFISDYRAGGPYGRAAEPKKIKKDTLRLVDGIKIEDRAKIA